jgi:deoxyribodipyrimidine photo-lyase
LTKNRESIQKPKLSIFWFRRDLRLHDNAGLFEALNSNPAVLPIFIFDQDILDKLADKRDRRVSFIYKSICKLQEQLIAQGNSLLVLYGKPKTVFQELLQQYEITSVYANHDYEPYAIERDASILGLLRGAHIPFYTFKDQVLYEKSDILKGDGSPYTIFTPYSKAWKQKLSHEEIKSYPSESLAHHFYKSKPIQILTLESLGFTITTLEIPPSLINESVIRQYHETRNYPYLSGTSLLSVHLRFGTVSIRDLIKAAINLNEQWLNELIWREFFMMILFQFPYVVRESFKRKYDFITWRNNESEFNKWCEGNTGYAIVDAGMRELNETGFMHNRVRMVVASFLTKHLLIDWRWGEAYFADKLLDYELSSNNGNWQWAAGCGCDAAPYFRIFNPTEQLRKFDPDLIYVNKWVKNLNEMDYPAPIVDHKLARERVLKAYKTALEHTSPQ